MKCPKCGSEELTVLEKKESEKSTTRTKQCDVCKAKFTTVEVIKTAERRWIG